VFIGEVVPAREGLRLSYSMLQPLSSITIGEVVPAREGLRPDVLEWSKHILQQSEKWFQQEKD